MRRQPQSCSASFESQAADLTLSLFYILVTPRLFDACFEFVLESWVLGLRREVMIPLKDVGVHPGGLVIKPPIHDGLPQAWIEKILRRSYLANGLQGSYAALELAFVLQKVAAFLEELESEREGPGKKIGCGGDGVMKHERALVQVGNRALHPFQICLLY